MDDELKQLYDRVCVAAKGESLQNVPWYKMTQPRFRGMAAECLFDSARTLKLMEIVKENTQEGSAVIDIGAGSGVLGFTASAAGAAHVVLNDRSWTYADVMGQVARELGYRSVGKRMFEKDRKTVEIVRRNIFKYEPDRSFNAVICEMVGDALLSENIIPAMQHIRPHLNEGAELFPNQVKLSVRLRGDSLKGDYNLSDRVPYQTIDLSTTQQNGVTCHIPIQVTGRGLLSNVRLFTELEWPGERSTPSYPSLCNYLDAAFSAPLVLPGVGPGNTINLFLTYSFAQKREKRRTDKYPQIQVGEKEFYQGTVLVRSID